jgi:soluble lytic murein transglycosylase-like protein
MARNTKLLLSFSTAAILAVASPVIAEGDSRQPIIFENDGTFWSALTQKGKDQAATPAAKDASESKAATRSAAKNAPATHDAPSGLKASIARHAAAHGVPVALAQAVIKVESRFNPRASNAGNYGLMQIRHQTARGVGYTGSAAGLLDAETNLRYGMAYLAQAYRAAGGETCGTIMRYQSGLGATRMNGANRAYCSKVLSYVAQG